VHVPIDGKRWNKANYAWTLRPGVRVYQAAGLALERSIAQEVLRRIPGETAARRQGLLLDYDRRLADHYASQLNPAVTHVVVAQSLLPRLWELGVLGGRTFDVLLMRSPLQRLQEQLDRGAEVHPESPTLGDFRCDRSLLRAEGAALAAARQLITPHRDLALLFPFKTVLLDWWLPVMKSRVESASTSKTILFPASTLGRKGAYEVREVARELGLRVRVLGQNFEGDRFWDGVELVPNLGDPFDDVGLGVLPAYVEHQPRLLLRAMALGVPVIASAACGVEAGAGVTIVPTGDVAALRGAIRSALGEVAPQVS
jgi:hypothetical protein